MLLTEAKRTKWRHELVATLALASGMLVACSREVVPIGGDPLGTGGGLRGADVTYSMGLTPAFRLLDTWRADGGGLALPGEPIVGPDDLVWASPWQVLAWICHDASPGTMGWRRVELGFAPGCTCAGAPPTGNYALLVESL